MAKNLSSSEDASSPHRLSSVTSALRLLKAFSADESELGITTLAQRMGLAKSTIVPSSAKAADPFAAALRVGQAAVQAEAAAKKNEDGEGGSKQRLKELSAFVESRLQERGATLVSLWREASQSSEPRVREEFEYSLSR